MKTRKTDKQAQGKADSATKATNHEHDPFLPLEAVTQMGQNWGHDQQHQCANDMKKDVEEDEVAPSLAVFADDQIGGGRGGKRFGLAGHN